MEQFSLIILVVATFISGIATILDNTLTRNKQVPHLASVVSFALVRLPVVLTGLMLLSHVSSEIAVMGLISGICYWLAVWRYFQLVALYPVSELSPMFRIVTPQVWWMGIWLLGDKPGAHQQWATLLLIFGGLLLTLKLGSLGLGFSRAAIHMLPITVLLSIEQTFKAQVSRLTTPWHALYFDAAGYCISCGAFLLISLARQRSSWQAAPVGSWPILIGQQTTRLALGLAPIYVISLGLPLGIASSISSMSPLVVLVLAAIFLGERPDDLRDLLLKLLGLALITSGIILLFG